MERRPDILVLSINYSPEPSGFAPHVAAFCEKLAADGKKVTVLTGFPFAPRWSRWPEYRGRFLTVEHRGGVQVVRLTHFIPRSPRRLIERILMEGSFCLSALWSLGRFRLRPGAMIYVGAQPTIAMLCRLIATLRGIRYGLMINDLATGAANEVGIVESVWLSRCMHWFEYTAYRGAAGAVVLCDGFKRVLVSEGFPSNRIRIVHSPVDTNLIRPLMPRNETFRFRFGVDRDDFVVLFAGSMGLKQGLGNVIEAARTLAGDKRRVRWLLVGDGETRFQIEQLIRQFNLEPFVKLIPFQPETEMSKMFSAADLLLLNQLSSVKDSVIPSKLLTYMSAGRPVIAAVNAASQGAQLLNKAGGGRVVPPEDPVALATMVIAMAADPGILRDMGRANRIFAVNNFDQVKIMQQLADFVLLLSEPVQVS